MIEDWGPSGSNITGESTITCRTPRMHYRDIPANESDDYELMYVRGASKLVHLSLCEGDCTFTYDKQSPTLDNITYGGSSTKDVSATTSLEPEDFVPTDAI